METKHTTFFLSKLQPIGFGLDPLCGDCALAGKRTSVNQPVVAEYYFDTIKGKQVYLCGKCAKSRNLL